MKLNRFPRNIIPVTKSIIIDYRIIIKMLSQLGMCTCKI